MENDILIDFRSTREKPKFGDLFLIVGEEHPKFPPKNRAFEQLAPLGFEQLDDFFGILNDEEGGDDVIVWLFPMIRDEEVFHNSGPFDAARLSYSALRNAPGKLALLEACFDKMKAELDVTVFFEGNTIQSFAPVAEKAAEIIAFWREKNIEPGSDESLLQEEEEEDWEEEEGDWEEEEGPEEAKQ